MGVRRAGIEDVKSMSYIHSQTWKKAYVDFISEEYLNNLSDDGWIPLFLRAFREKLHEAAVFEVDGNITGTVTFGQGRKGIDSERYSDNYPYSTGVNPVDSLNYKSGGEIISLYVLPQYWSTKQGYMLTKFAVDALGRQGYGSCYIWVIRDNERAVNFYKRFGFKRTGELMTVMLAGLPVVEEKYKIML
ncbi:MAG: acetyltransferase, N-acetylglutamate synthase [Eubacterium sp.]|jgi:ribosomal protein S18 acetylase RimI-like enzyme|nr:acetyltransferase, N-acetylglutamate synthase [Eubacterium sp.]